MQSKKNVIKDKISYTNTQEEENHNENTVNPIQIHKEMMWESTNENRLFYSNVDMIDFRYVENGRLSDPFILSIYNNSTEKLKLKWLLEKEINTSNLTKNTNIFNDPNIHFIVTPEETTVNKGSVAEFKVYFRPSKPEYYFFTHLTCLGTLLTDYSKDK
jgi:hypothetical protein